MLKIFDTISLELIILNLGVLITNIDFARDWGGYLITLGLGWYLINRANGKKPRIHDSKMWILFFAGVFITIIHGIVNARS